MKKTKKFLSVMLALLMIVSIIPMSSITAFAAYENTYVNTGNQRADIIGVAKTQLGYKEGSNNDTKYGDWYGLPNQPWCAMFVTWCARQAGIPNSIIKKCAVASPKSSYFNIPYYDGASYIPKSGDLFFTKEFSHVGLVYYIDGNYFYSIEGNANDKCCSLKRKISDYYFGVPKYEDNSISTLSIKYDANGGIITDSDEAKYYLNDSDVVYRKSTSKVFTQEMVDGITYDSGLYNRTTFGISRKGYTFVGWGTKASGGTVYNQNDPMTAKQLCSTIGNGDQTITLYAIWAPNELSVYYNVNGGKVTLEEFTLNSDVIYKNDEKFVQTWTYNVAKDTGLVNPKSFGLKRTGYTFMGWGTKSSGGTIFDQNDTTLLPTDIKSGIEDGNCSRTLYAIWQAKTYTIEYNANGGNGTMATSSHTYDTAKALSANRFTRTGYTFLGWSTSATATVAKYTDGQSVKNLASSDGSIVTLYAVWSKNEHTPGMWTVATPATCTKEGLTILRCTTCGEIIAEKELPVIDHTASAWETVVSATCTTEGVRQKVCTVCGETVIREDVLATGHTVGSWEVVSEATCVTEGFKVQKCIICKEIICSEDVPTTDHVYGEWITAIEPTCKSVGIKIQYCYKCGVGLKNQEIPLEKHAFENGKCTVCGETDPSYVPSNPDKYSFSIQTPSRTTIRSKDGIVLHANIEGTVPTGSYVEWSWNNSKFDVEKNTDGTLTIISENNGKTIFTATLNDADGSVLATDSIEMTSKAGFFDKIGAFFRSLFGRTVVYEY